MTGRRKVMLAIAGLVVVVALVAAGLFVRRLLRRPPGVPAASVPASWETFRESRGHQMHVGKEGVTCRDCHDVDKEGFRNPGVAPCARCHEKQESHAHGGTKAEATSCFSCHSFAPGVSAPTCLSCHDKVQDGASPIHVHATIACVGCHTPHADAPAAKKTCTNCHEQRDTRHAAHAESRDCADCHTPHAEKTQARAACAGCHATPAGPKPAGHDSCLGCHQPHDVAGPGVNACAGCHTTKQTLAETRVPKHAVCTSCHAPHAPEKAAASCVHCHADVHAQHDNHDACATCHVAHGSDPGATATSCSTCHKAVAATDRSAHGGHVACTACHNNHDFRPASAAVGAGRCATCHERETTLVSANHGHGACATCHGADPHQPKKSPVCASCHAKEAATAPAGHRACANCHEPHGGKTLASATCTSCHAKESSSIHGNEKGGCATCHRPHGPGGVAKPPACVTCHERAKLPALHAANGHATCSSCHSSHGPLRADRATCTGNCHTDKRDHQPAAQVCDGCHVFRK